MAAREETSWVVDYPHRCEPMLACSQEVVKKWNCHGEFDVLTSTEWRLRLTNDIVGSRF